MTQRSGSNLGIEDLLDLDGSEDDRDMTLVRQPGGFQLATSHKVNTNGTSESNNTKNKKHFGIFQNKQKSEGDQQGGSSDLSDTNKKILSHWNSGVEKGMKIFQYGFGKTTKWDETKKSGHDSDGQSTTNTLQQGLQNVMQFKSQLDPSQIFSTLTHGAAAADKTFFSAAKIVKKEEPDEPQPVVVPTPPTAEKNCLEQFLELDHGEFQFIDEAAATLTRNVSPPPPLSSSSSRNQSISSLANEIFQELGKSSLNDEISPSTSRFRHHHQHRRRRNLSTASMTSVPPLENGSSNNDYYCDTSWSESIASSSATANPKPDSSAKQKQRRYRNLSTASMTASSSEAAAQFIPKTDSQLIASLLEDQTLWLRHQKKHRRRQPIQPWVPGAKWQLQPRLQGQEDQVILRRCSSLTQTNTDEMLTQPQQTDSPRLSSPGIRFLYNGKYRPASNNSDQNQFVDNRRISMISTNQQSGPWLLSNNLSTFARRRRSSSTSLHAFQDDVLEDNTVYNNNNIKPLTDGELFGEHR